MSPSGLATPSSGLTGYRLGGSAWSLAKERGGPVYMPSAEELGGRACSWMGIYLVPL